MVNQQAQLQFIEKMKEVLSTNNGRYKFPMATYLKITDVAMKNHITEIFSKYDYSKFSKTYCETNQGLSASLTGDFLTDHPALGLVEVDDFICITL